MSAETVEPQRPVGRGEKVRTAVHAATLTELAAHGYTALSIENVARRAGVHKTTVYRRWGDRETLLLDTLTTRNVTAVPIPDTGDLESDLDALARDVIATVDTPFGRALLAALQSDLGRVPEIAHTLEKFFQDRFQRGAPVVTRALARGEIPSDTEPVEVLRTLISPLYMRLLLTGEPLDDIARRRAVAATMAAARSGALGREVST